VSESRSLPVQDKITIVGSILICIFLVYEKLTNDVKPFDALTVACTPAVLETVTVERRESVFGVRQSPVLRFDVRGGEKGTIHGWAPYWDTVLSAVELDREVCIWFDPDSRTHRVYQVQIQGAGVVLEYGAVARWNAWNLNGLVVLILGFTLVYVPYALTKHRRVSRAPAADTRGSGGD
jgi:hypothetical protein